MLSAALKALGSRLWRSILGLAALEDVLFLRPSLETKEIDFVYSMLQKRNSAMAYSESFLKTLSSTLRELWLLRETDLTFDVVPGQSSRSYTHEWPLLTAYSLRRQRASARTEAEAGADGRCAQPERIHQADVAR